MQILQLLRNARPRASSAVMRAPWGGWPGERWPGGRWPGGLLPRERLLERLMLGGLLLGGLSLGGCAAPPRHSVFSGDPTLPVETAPADSAASNRSPGTGTAMKPHSEDEGSGDASAEAVLAAARSYLGVPYRYGGESRDGVDCSGLVLRAYASCGVSLPRSCAAQYTRGVAVGRDELAPGDLVFFGKKGSSPSHVGLYEGNGHFIHASTGHRAVRRDSLDLRWFDEHYRGARRVLPAP